MKSPNRILALTGALLFSAAGLFAQTTPTTPTTTTPAVKPTTPTTVVPAPTVPPTTVPTIKPTTTTTPPVTLPPQATDHPGQPNANASDNAKAVQALLQKFDVQRDALMASRMALIEKLKTATGDERAKILAQLRAEQDSNSAEGRVLGKQIRDELKKQRKGGGG